MNEPISPIATASRSPANQVEKGRRRVAVVGLSYPFRGGISHYTTLLVRALRDRHDVSFLTLRRQYPEFLFPGQTQFDFSARTLFEPNERIIDTLNPLTWWTTARRLNREQPELIIFQWWHPFFAPPFGTIIRLLAAPLRRRVCFLCHNVMPHEGNPLQGLLTRYGFASAPFFIVHSEQDRRQLAALRPGVTVRKSCHPTYTEFADGQVLSKEEARRAIGIREDRDTLLFFGLVRPYKGLKVLLRAMSLVLERRDCQLLVVGEFYDDRSQYTELIEQCGIAERVKVVDQYVPNEEVAKYFHSADVAVLPYISATQSGIVQIAFGLGTPVITTDVGGLPEAVDHGKTGLIVPAQNAERLAAAILDYYDNDRERGFRAEIARQTNRFSWDEEVAHIDEFVSASA